jgi:hypothetical protein
MTPLPLNSNREAFWPARLGVLGFAHKLCRGCKTVRHMPKSSRYCASCVGPQRIRQLQKEVKECSVERVVGKEQAS